jgi:hypothetical protein
MQAVTLTRMLRIPSPLRERETLQEHLFLEEETEDRR